MRVNQSFDRVKDADKSVLVDTLLYYVYGLVGLILFHLRSKESKD